MKTTVAILFLCTLAVLASETFRTACPAEPDTGKHKIQCPKCNTIWEQLGVDKIKDFPKSDRISPAGNEVIRDRVLYFHCPDTNCCAKFVRIMVTEVKEGK